MRPARVLAALAIAVLGGQATCIRPGLAQPAASRPGTANLADFLPAAGGDAARALRAAFDSLPPAGGRIDVPAGAYAWKSCASLDGKSVAIVGAGLGSAVFSVQAAGCDALAITEPDEAHSVVLRDFSMQAAPGTAAGTAVTVAFPSRNDPATHAKLNSVQTQDLLVENVQLISPNADPSASFKGGMDLQGVWNGLVRNVQVSCRIGEPAPGSFGFRYGQTINLLFSFVEAVACDAGIDQVDYAEGTELHRASLIGANVSLRIRATPNTVNGMALDQLVVDGGELTAHVSAIQALGRVAEGFVHDSHLLLLSDRSAAGAASCPAGNTANQAAILLNGAVQFSLHDLLIAALPVRLADGTECHSVATGLQLNAGTSAVQAHDIQFDHLGVSVGLDSSARDNALAGLRTLAPRPGLPLYVDQGRGNLVSFVEAGEVRVLRRGP